ncbi:PAS domain S-box protein [Exilibacterium tricleocarpae]|uniref:histidine kinase n=1 Tax=Exilibacterium tricleocarpae TaxID=2591008 RepID=A0A545TSG5_9GAMM|nr:PAS domain S-box protein [Exilibacterium tricleocarpae]TQV80155.1 PAS domain S-box protein [Exilibacterium tricleocarpae]
MNNTNPKHYAAAQAAAAVKVHSPGTTNTDTPTMPSFPVWLLALPLAACLPPLLSGWGISLASVTEIPPIQAVNGAQVISNGLFFHTLLEAMGAVTATILLAVALSHYNIRRDTAVPLLALALAAGGSADAVHALLAAAIPTAPPNPAPILLTATIARATGAVALLLATAVILLARPRRLIFGTPGVLVIWVLVSIAVYALTDWMVSGGQPAGSPLVHASPGVIFLACLPLTWRLYQQRRDFFTATITIAVTLNTLLEVCLNLGSEQLFDHYFNAVHGLKITGFALPLAGLLLDWQALGKCQRQQLSADPNYIESESDHRFRAFTEQLPVGVLLVDTDGVIVSVNRGARELFGYQEEQLVGENVDKLVPVNIRHRHQALRNGYQYDPKPRRMAADVDYLTGVRSDGTEVPLEIGLGPIRLNGRTHTLVSVLDISERKQLLDDLKQKNTVLQESEQRLRAITEQLPVGVLLVDTGGAIVSTNHSARELFAYGEQQLEGENVDKLVPGSIRHRHRVLREGYQYDPKPRRMAADEDVLTGVRSDGIEVPLEIGLGPTMLDGRPHTVVSVMDISERKRLLDDLTDKNILMDQTIEKLTQSNEQLERFAFICSHDLQEPVRMVHSFSQLLEQRLTDHLEDKEREYLKFITDGAQRARNMISDVLMFCRLDQPVDSRKSVSLAEVCQQVYNTLHVSLEESRGKFTWSDELPTVTAVPSQLFQLLLNLVGNGLKFNRSDTPTVSLNSSLEDNFCRIEIHDNGIGIKPQYQQKIFQIFERLNAKKEYPGTGIGLAICKKIAEQHEARLLLESEEGEGSTFVLLWPLYQATKTEAFSN